VVLELPGIARDVDRPEDLHELAAASGDRRSQKLVRSWKLSLRKLEKTRVETGLAPS
jgi:2-phospho-L-lactate guanylyltransferase (CobY/MobA/RfbA family)